MERDEFEYALSLFLLAKEEWETLSRLVLQETSDYEVAGRCRIFIDQVQVMIRFCGLSLGRGILNL